MTGGTGNKTVITEIRNELFRLQDAPYREFQRKLIPTIAPETVIGVRTPALRVFAKELSKRADAAVFLADLPHRYFEENQLHALIIAEQREFARCIAELTRFLPFVDNWATCDQMLPKAFGKNREALLPHVRQWLASDHAYTVRYGIGTLMRHYLDDAFDPAYPAAVAQLRSDEYYVNMMIAWYFATALARQYDAVLPYLEQKKLAPWTHNKAIQKAIESRQIPPEHKTDLKRLRLK